MRRLSPPVYSQLTFHVGPSIFRHAALPFKPVRYAPLFMPQYKNVRADVSPPVSTPLWQLIYSFAVSYFGAIWNVVNFEEAKARFAEAT